MAGWKDFFAKHGSSMEDQWDELRARMVRKMSWNDPVQVIPYRTYGTCSNIYIKGRVLEDKKIAKAADQDTIWNNIVNMYKRFESDELPGARLQISVSEEKHEVITDKEGYFVLKINPETPITRPELWHQIPIQLVHANIPFEQGLTVNAEVMIPPADAEYGIISDIDDTIVRTNATSLLAMGRITFLNNAKTRLPFAGVAEFYKALQLGRNGKRNNPLFYVSSSPWNLYDLLVDFLDLNKIPVGPLLLRDFGLEPNKQDSDHMRHKLKEIEQILNAYPELNFVLVGDSGQEDPVIYREVVKHFPGRILAIYIRDVMLPARKKIAIEVSDSLKHDKVEMLIVENTVSAAEHAAATGLIYSEAIPKIEADKKEDEGTESGKEELELV